jgi:hypothetical protein
MKDGNESAKNFARNGIGGSENNSKGTQSGGSTTTNIWRATNGRNYDSLCSIATTAFARAVTTLPQPKFTI